MIANSSSMAIRQISDEMNLDRGVVEEVIKAYHAKINLSLKNELPFRITSLGTFYFQYRKLDDKASRGAEFFSDRVHKRLKFKVSTDAMATYNSWVQDLGFKNNLKEELLRVSIRPEELPRIRKKKMLEEQRQVGFRPELLFGDEHLSETDKHASRRFDEAPSAEDIIQRITVNLSDSD